MMRGELILMRSGGECGSLWERRALICVLSGLALTSKVPTTTVVGCKRHDTLHCILICATLKIRNFMTE